MYVLIPTSGTVNLDPIISGTNNQDGRREHLRGWLGSPDAASIYVVGWVEKNILLGS